MQANDMVLKARVYVDGEELKGLVNIEETTFEKVMVEVPEFRRIRQLSADVQKINDQLLVQQKKDVEAML